MNPEALPQWLRVGAGGGLVLIVGTAAFSYFFREALGSRSMGTQQDPFPPDEETPPKDRFLFPDPTPIQGPELAAAVRRGWKALHGGGAPVPGATISALLVQARLAGGPAVGWNVVQLRADRFWRGAWTVRREPEWHNGRPSFRWAPIRAYGSLDAAVYDWLSVLPEAAIAALRSGDVRAFAEALVEAGWANAPAAVYIPEMLAAVGSTLPKAAPTAAQQAAMGRRPVRRLVQPVAVHG